MRRVRALSVTVCLGLLMVACGGDDAPSSVPVTSAEGTGSSTTIASANIDREATVRIAYTTFPTFLDPHKQTSQAGDNMLFDRLFNFDRDKQLKPGLATKWDLSADGKTVTLTLRQGVNFNDGTVMDSAAVKASLQRAKSLPTSVWASFLASITSIDAVDAYTVRLNLSQPDAALLQTLAKPAGSIMSAKAIAEGKNLDTSDQDAGTTPYRVVSFTAGQSLTVERRSNVSAYWDPDAWTVKRFELTSVVDPLAALNAVKTGAVDVATPRRTAAELKQDLQGTKLAHYSLESDNILKFSLRSTRAKFADKSVRQAIAQALDLKTLTTSGALLTDCTYVTQFFLPDAPGYIENFAPLAYDPAKAKAALTAAGPFSFEMTYPVGSNERQAVAEYAQQQLKQYGVNVTVTPLQLNQSISQFGAGERDALVLAVGGETDPVLQQGKLYVQTYKSAGPSEADVTKLINDANALPLGSPQRAAKLQELNRFGLENAFSIPVCRGGAQWVADPDIIGIPDMAWQWTGQFDARYWAVKKS